MELLAPDGSHPKSYFLKHNGLDKIFYDLDFSVLQKYRCFANCKNCYTKDLWIPSAQIRNYIPSAIGADTRAQLANVFEYFEIVSIIDDLKFIKDEVSHLWGFYKDNPNLFYLSSLNDNAIFRHFSILTEEFFPLGIHEICISEEFYSRQRPNEIVQMLAQIHLRVPIKAITFYAEHIGEGTDANDLGHWSHDRGIQFSVSRSAGDSVSQSLASRSQSLFLMSSEFYSDLKTATKSSGRPFARLQDFDPKSFLFKTLKARMGNLSNELGGDTADYYHFLRQNLNIYDDYNFIPLPVLPPYAKFYKTLVAKGLAAETKYGLLIQADSVTDKIKPLIDFNNKE